MRILIIHTFYQGPGGEDTVFLQETALLSKDHEVETLTFQNKKGWKGALQTIFSIWNFLASRRVKAALRTFKPDVVHIHNTHYASGPIIIRSISKLDLPIVMTLHNFRLLCPSAILYHDHHLFLASLSQNFPWTAVRNKVMDNSALKTFILASNYWFHRKIGTWRKINRYICLTEFAKELFTTSTLNVPKSSYHVKPNFTFPMETNSENKEDYFIFIGRLTEEKGILPLLAAFKQTNLKLFILGDGELKQAVSDAEINHPNIQYLGFKSREEVIKLVKEATALVVPSLWFEGMPMTILEAFSVGTPVLGSDIGALQELIIPNQTGLLFNPHDVENMLTTINRWNNYSEEEKFNIRKTTKYFYFSNFTPEINKKQLIAIYREAHQAKKRSL